MRESDSPSRMLEFFAAFLLVLAALGSAWSAFQANQWNGTEQDEARAASRARVEGSRLFGLGTQRLMYDAVIASQYAEAVADGDTRLQDFIKNALARDPLLPVIEEWAAAAQKDPASATNLLENTEYLTAQFAEATAAELPRQEALAALDVASDNADDYVRTSLILATALFFAGIMATFRSFILRAGLLSAACVVVAVGASRLAELPVA